MTDIAKIISTLSSEQREILIQKLNEQGNQFNIFPLSFAQQRLWLLYQLDKDNPAYNIPFAIRLTGALDLSALRFSFAEIIRRHEVLRTIFTSINGRPLQFVSNDILPDFSLVDLTQIPEEIREHTAREMAGSEAQNPFYLQQGPLMRVRLYRLSGKEYILLLVMHHIISDGWSTGILVRELIQFYQAKIYHTKSDLKPLSIQYADYAKWQRDWLSGERLETLLNYWKNRLKDSPPILELPTDKPRPNIYTYKGGKESRLLPKKVADSVKAFSNKEGVTPFMFLLAVFKLLLFRYSNQEDICVGTPVANRNREEIEGLIGFFVNTLVIRTDLSGNPKFGDFLNQIREISLEAYSHQDLPFEILVEKLQPERDMGHTPFFQVMFTYQNAPKSVALPDLKLVYFELNRNVAKFDLTFSVSETGNGFQVLAEYNRDLFYPSTIAKMMAHYETLLTDILEQPDRHISVFNLMPPEERSTILNEWNRTESSYPKDKCVHELFEINAEQFSDSIALNFDDQYVSYECLNERANQLAHYLYSLEIKPEEPVGLFMERSPELIIGILAVLKAGGVYLPLDPDYPQSRLFTMIEDAGTRILLTQTSLAERFSELSLRIISLDKEWNTISEYSIDNPQIYSAPENLAYIMYTSGSTGKPKGISIPHRAIARLVLNTNYVELTSDDRIIHQSNSSFDAATFEIWGALLTGARLVGIQKETAISTSDLIRVLKEQQISILFITTALFNNLIRENPQGLQFVQNVYFGGEAADPQIAEAGVQKNPSTRIVNVYGPTENTTFTTFYIIENKPEKRFTIPIGKPISNTTAFIMDSQWNLVPVGVNGELCTGGDGLARGYLNKPALTAEKFIPDPFTKTAGQRLYRTGDLARYQSDGNIEFQGRIDNQVKIRGFRIELGEIETVLSQHPQIQQAVVLAREDVPGQKYLAAYIVPRPESQLDWANIRKFLQIQLPDYMVPAVFMDLEKIPVNSNGKIDRKALPLPDRSRIIVSDDFVAPRTPLEDILAGIWCEILNLKQVSINDNFFDLGGHSLLATQVISRLKDALKLEIPLRTLFEAPVLAQLADCIDKFIRSNQGIQTPPIQPVPRDKQLPLSFAQQRLWFIEQVDPGNPSYNMPGAFRLEGNLNTAALEAGINEIVSRHESLRTRFSIMDGMPVQIIMPCQHFQLPVIDLSEFDSRQAENMARQLIAAEALRPFSLEKGNLFRICLIRLNEQQHIVVFNMHHIISDEWSLGILVRELKVLYEHFCEGKPSPLPDLRVQYADYAFWQRNWLQGEVLEKQLTYWKQQLGGELPVLKLSFDYERPGAQTFEGAVHSFSIAPDISTGLKSLGRKEDATLFMVMLTAFGILLYRYSEQDDILIGTDIANRSKLETEGLIGFFVNHLVLRTQIKGNPVFRNFLKQVREITLGAYAHQDLPFDRLVSALQPNRQSTHTPLFQVLFVFGNPSMPVLELPGLTLSPVKSDVILSKYDLTLFINDKGDTINGVWRYRTELFKPETIVRMSDHFQQLLQSIASHPDSRVNQLEMLSGIEKEENEIQKRKRDENRSKKLKNISRKTFDISPDVNKGNK